MFMYTTQTAVSTLKKTAKQIVKQSTSIKLSAALEEASVLAGYDNFHHVTECLKESSQMELGWAPSLPELYVKWFEKHHSRLRKTTQRTFDNETVFGFHLKYADDLEQDDFEELEDAWILCGQDIARQTMFSSNEEVNNERNFDIYPEEYIKELVEMDIGEFRFFKTRERFNNISAIKSHLDNSVFFWPDYIWHKGICLDLRDHLTSA